MWSQDASDISLGDVNHVTAIDQCDVPYSRTVRRRPPTGTKAGHSLPLRPQSGGSPTIQVANRTVCPRLLYRSVENVLQHIKGFLEKPFGQRLAPFLLFLLARKPGLSLPHWQRRDRPLFLPSPGPMTRRLPCRRRCVHRVRPQHLHVVQRRATGRTAQLVAVFSL